MTERNQILGGILLKVSKFIWVISLAAPGVSVAQNVTIYTDILTNGWQDYGYATENYTNTSPVHSGGDSISVTITAGFQGIQIHHPVFTNTPYSSISFWLNGGPAGGQHLRVYGVLGGVNQATNYPLSAPLANVWQQYTVPLAGFGVANATNFEAFVIQDSAGTAEPVFYLDDIQLNSAAAPPATFTNLHTFANLPEAGNPYAGLILSGNALYGTTYYGGTNHVGMVFKVNTDGTGFTDVYSFYPFYSNPVIPNTASLPRAGLILSGNTLYGTTQFGGPNNYGTMFAINTDGTGFTDLYEFSDFNNSYATNSDGGEPQAGLILSGNTLYGTTRDAGTSGNGVIFAFNTASMVFTNLHSFTATSNAFITNCDGALPQAGLILSGNTLYGTAFGGGTNGRGTVFAINTDGTGFTNLHSFSFLSDGANPVAGLILSGNTLYGTVNSGGSNGMGAVFKVNTNGSGFKNLYSFTAPNSGTNSDGANPAAGLILSGNTLYGTASGGGLAGRGTVFAVNTNGTGFTTLYSFTALNSGTNSDGANPVAGLILSSNTLYGTASFGGTNAYGTVFSITLPGPTPLNISRSGTNIFLTWPTNDVRFILQSATNLVSSALWSTVSPAPVAINGRYVVTNGISGTRRFYRLSQ